jgi:hypothetical protein
MAVSKKKPKAKRDVGRPTRYKAEYAEQAYNYCLLGATDTELAGFFGVVESTLNLWKKVHKEFSESVTRGKDIADAKVARALYDGCTDRYVIEQQVIKVKVDQYEEEVKTVDVVKVIPADFRNQQFWLKNRQKNKWRDKTEQGFTDKDNNDLFNHLTEAELDDEIKAAEEKLHGAK